MRASDVFDQTEDHRPLLRLPFGCDEVGTGALFGPVVVAIAALDPEIPGKLWESLRDSKAIAPRKRERIADALRPHAYYALGAASAREVDRVGPLVASHLAMRRAYLRLPYRPDLVRVDGPHRPDLPCAVEAHVSGDRKFHEIMAASILAKVARDRLVKGKLAARYPEYGLQSHSGYATAQHYEALARQGLTPHHRERFLRPR